MQVPKLVVPVPVPSETATPTVPRPAKVDHPATDELVTPTDPRLSNSIFGDRKPAKK
ncbi:MAG: hypothetical protein IPJ78_10590 [Gemmatimonadetes bacterium]|jgi:hypothetical protein|nr:hypothetical protein [Gemmatimonadota bacterium]MBP7551125.1 hypothetical protein [Gemmatimonadaceae bacterium]